jgi:hypothetical protein
MSACEQAASTDTTMFALVDNARRQTAGDPNPVAFALTLATSVSQSPAFNAPRGNSFGPDAGIGVA